MAGRPGSENADLHAAIEAFDRAYAHNDALLVAEGELVKAGQQIARKGSSGTNTVKLHFEIRKEGKPIDPTRLLPRR